MSSGDRLSGLEYDEPEEEHPLTGEVINIRNFINDLVNSSRINILQALTDREYWCASDVSASVDVSRQTASKHLREFIRWGMTNRGEDPRNQRITAGGQFVVDSLAARSDVVSQEQLGLLTRSACASQLLHALKRGPIRPKRFAEEEPMSPSRSTIQRVLETFTCHGWCHEEHGRYRFTAEGPEVLDAYQTVVGRIVQAIKKAAFLQRLSPTYSDFPPESLADAETYVSDPSSPAKALSFALKLCDTDLHHFRALTSIYNAKLFIAYYKIFNLGLDGEAIVDASVYQEICENEKTAHLVDDSKYDRYRLLRLKEELTLGIGIYDDRKVAIGAFNKTGNGRHTAIMISSNDEFVEWGINLYESIREHAWRPNHQPSSPTHSYS